MSNNGKDFRDHLLRFAKITDEIYQEILGYFTPQSVAKSTRLVTEGKKVDHTWWVVKGLLISSYTDDKGREHIIQFATEGCWITDQHAFYNRQQASFNIMALEESELLSISFLNREKLCADHHPMETFFRKKANDSFVKQQQRLLTYLTADAAKRFELLMQEYPGLLQRIPKKLLAQYLGVSRETLSRIQPGAISRK